MMKPKEYLKSIGVEAGGRGRMPAAHKALILEAVAKGIQIEGYAIVKPTAAVSKPTAPVVERVKVSTSKEIAEVADPRYDAHEWKAVWADNGKPLLIGIHGVCGTCGNSFSHHYCAQPTYRRDDILMDVIIVGKGTK